MGGAIDGAYISIISPSEHHADSGNRKGSYSVIMQGVCKHRYLFIDLYIGWPRRVPDSRVLATPIYIAEVRTGHCSEIKPYKSKLIVG